MHRPFWITKSNTFFFVQHVGQSAGSTNQNFIFSYISQNTSAALVPPFYLPQRPLNHLMELFVQRVFTQIVMCLHEILRLHLCRATVFVTSSVVATSTSNLSMFLIFNTTATTTTDSSVPVTNPTPPTVRPAFSYQPHNWRCAGTGLRSLVRAANTVTRYLGLNDKRDVKQGK